MSIEIQLERIATALERLAAPAADKPPTLEEVREAAKSVVKKFGVGDGIGLEKLKELLKPFGAENTSELKEAQYPEAMEVFRNALA